MSESWNGADFIHVKIVNKILIIDWTLVCIRVLCWLGAKKLWLFPHILRSEKGLILNMNFLPSKSRFENFQQIIKEKNLKKYICDHWPFSDLRICGRSQSFFCALSTQYPSEHMKVVVGSQNIFSFSAFVAIFWFIF